MNQRFETFAAEVAAGRRAVARDAAHAQWGAFGREDAYDVVALEIPFDGRDAHGEDARGLALRDEMCIRDRSAGLVGLPFAGERATARGGSDL